MTAIKNVYADLGNALRAEMVRLKAQGHSNGVAMAKAVLNIRPRSKSLGIDGVNRHYPEAIVSVFGLANYREYAALIDIANNRDPNLASANQRRAQMAKQSPGCRAKAIKALSYRPSVDEVDEATPRTIGVYKRMSARQVITLAIPDAPELNGRNLVNFVSRQLEMKTLAFRIEPLRTPNGILYPDFVAAALFDDEAFIRDLNVQLDRAGSAARLKAVGERRTKKAA